MKQSYIKKLLDHYNTIKLSNGTVELLSNIMFIFETKLLRAMKKNDSLQNLKSQLEESGVLVTIDEFGKFFNKVEADKLAIRNEELKLDTKTKNCKKVSDTIRYKFSFKDFKKHCIENKIILFPIPSELKSIINNGPQFSERKVVKDGRSYLIPILCNNNMIVDNENHSEYVYSTIMLRVFLTILNLVEKEENVLVLTSHVISALYKNMYFFNLLGMKITPVEISKLIVTEPLSLEQSLKLVDFVISSGYEINQDYKLASTSVLKPILEILSFEVGNDKAIKMVNNLFKEKPSEGSYKSIVKSRVKSTSAKKSMSQRTSKNSSIRSSPSRCKNYGVRSDGLCKKKPGRKSLSVKSSTVRRSPSPSKCKKYGVRSDGLCKKKPGRKSLSVKSYTVRRSPSPSKCKKYGVRSDGLCKKKPGRKSRRM
jgi:hypothetical protein